MDDDLGSRYSYAPSYVSPLFIDAVTDETNWASAPPPGSIPTSTARQAKPRNGEPLRGSGC